MNNLTNEQIKEILGGAEKEDFFGCRPDGYDFDAGSYFAAGSASSLRDLSEILTLRERVARLQDKMEVWRPIVEKIQGEQR